MLDLTSRYSIEDLKAMQGRSARKRSDPEHREQKALFRWAESVKRQYPELEWLHAVPNGGLRSKATAARLRAEGVRSGVWDVNLDVPRVAPDGKPYHGVKIEMKAPGGRLSREQKRWKEHYEAHGYYCIVKTAWTAVADELLWYLGYK